MSDDRCLKAVDLALASLKDFQKATVETVYSRLFGDSRRSIAKRFCEAVFGSPRKSMLVADEVGLGKTIVAKGLIAMALRERIQRGDKTPFKVTYICSNQAIAGENVSKLNVFKGHDLADTVVRRVAFLAYAPQESTESFSSGLVLNTLTPGTSFEISRGTGMKDERGIIYSLLCAESRMGAVRNGLACLLRGKVRGPAENLRRWMENQRDKKLRDELADSFLASIRHRTLKSKESPGTRGLLRIANDRNPSLYDAVYEMASLLRANNEDIHRGACNELARALRRVLIDACLKYVDADLFILDEFQRFKDLIDPDSDREEAEIARRVFQNRKARILLLSATPFKAFTGDMDLSNGEDHYGEFRKVLRFLMNGDSDTLLQYEKHRRALWHQLFGLDRENLNLSPEHRQGAERILRSVMCRTERQLVTKNPGAMILDKWQQDRIPFSLSDVHNYVMTDRIVAVLSKAYQRGHHAIGKPVEYCKSAPHPLSYLDGYAVKELLRECRRNKNVRRALVENRDAWLDVRSVNRYSLRIDRPAGASGGNTLAHARLADLVRESVGPDGAKLLWIPPSLPYYQLGGGFKNTSGFSKVLVFAGWVMVPRMIASLLSYEVERQTIGNPTTRESRETERRRYFAPRNKLNYRRHPVPLLVYRAEDGNTMAAKSMSNFCCLYPSISLANVYDPLASFQPTASVEEVRSELVRRINRLIEATNLKQYERSGGSPNRWYWIAPVLLDRTDPVIKRTVSYWLHDEAFLSDSPFFAADGRDDRGKRRHFTAFRDAFLAPEGLSLGRMPADLAEVLADMALGSPAVTTYRTLRRLFPNAKRKDSQQHLRGAFEVASEFINLFNKPESICAVRLSTPPSDYWRQVLRYCGDGCLQGVMDEYCHLTKGQEEKRESTVTHLRNTINITATSINVDSMRSFIRGRPYKMRCHYAVDFGNQKLESKEGQQRATSIRENFNSPFRPFVLATTSIGQEGLDFHQYCRKVVHWNLPGNPIDIEQREGRINRYKGLVIRQAIARRYFPQLSGREMHEDVWTTLFEVADREERIKNGLCELVPYWHINTDEVKIERIIPMYPFSRDRGKLQVMLKTLAIYRLAFGQPRQVELIEHLLKKDFTPEEVEEIRRNLMIDLSPIGHSGSVPR